MLRPKICVANLLAYLLEFHRREAKPKYWAMFTRQEMSDEELIDDAECIGVLSPDPARPPHLKNDRWSIRSRSRRRTSKCASDDKVLRAGSLETSGRDFRARRRCACDFAETGSEVVTHRGRRIDYS